MEIIFITLSFIFMISSLLLMKFSKPLAKRNAKWDRIEWKKEIDMSPPKSISAETYYKNNMIVCVILFIISVIILMIGLYSFFN